MTVVVLLDVILTTLTPTTILLRPQIIDMLSRCIKNTTKASLSHRFGAGSALNSFVASMKPMNKFSTVATPSSSPASMSPSTATLPDKSRAYSWVDTEAEQLIARAYGQHHRESACLLHNYKMTNEQLESLDATYHYPPSTVVDHVALGTMRFLRIFTHGFFKDDLVAHALLLETVAAVPGIVGAAFRHLRSLRQMEKDHGWIAPLQEEAENERMHLLIWMKLKQPSKFERFLVIAAQATYMTFYSGLYIFSPRSAHRMVGYLEEEAVLAYTAFLKSIDEGKVPNTAAPDIAIKYYGLPADATVRDVVLRVRADEHMHRDFNHMLGDKHARGDVKSPPHFMGVSNIDNLHIRM